MLIWPRGSGNLSDWDNAFAILGQSDVSPFQDLVGNNKPIPGASPLAVVLGPFRAGSVEQNL